MPVQIGSEAHKAFCCASLPGVNRAERGVDLPFPSGAEVLCG